MIKFLIQTTNATRTSFVSIEFFQIQQKLKILCLWKGWVFASQHYPFYLKIDDTKLILTGEVDVYLSPDLIITINLF